MDWEEKPRFPIPPGAILQPLNLPGKEGRSVCDRVNYFLREYQREGVMFLWDRFRKEGGGILADDMGLGKTIQIIALLSALYEKTGKLTDNDQNRGVVTGDEAVNPSLIICPSSVLANWEDEIKTWANFVTKRFYSSDREVTLQLAREGRCELVLTTFETAREHIDQLNQVCWKLVVVDECHRIKEPKAAITNALKSMQCLRRIGLTGTALQNNYKELWCLLDWANPGCLGSSQYFWAEFSSPMTKGFRFDASKIELATAREKQTRLNDLKSAWMIRRTKTKTIASQLPTKTDQVVFCSLSPFQLSVMASLVAHPDTQLVLKAWQTCLCGSRLPRVACCYTNLKNEDGVPPRKLLLQLIQVFVKAANHAALLLPGQSAAKSQIRIGEQVCRQAFKDQPKLLEDWKKGKFTAMSDTALSGKMGVLTGLLHVMDAKGDKVLLFSYSTKVLDILGMFLSSKGYSYRRLDGNTKTESRQKLVNEFNIDPGIFVFLVSTKAGGVGLNITGANAVIIFDPNWNPSIDLQAIDRAYRIGQMRDVNVYRLVSVGCIEEIIYLRQVYKQQLSASSVDGETACRYFMAVQGDKTRRGELFGIRNLFRVNPAGQCLTLDIEERNKAMEEKVRGRARGEFRIQNNMLVEEKEPIIDQKDPFLIGLDKEMDGEDPLDINQVLSRSGVVHSHTNQGLVGSSRAEQHISNCALKDVEAGRLVAAGNLPAQDCDVLSATQGLLDIPATGYEPRSSGNKPITKTSGSTTYVYGNTPKQTRVEIFRQMAQNLGLTVEQLAERVASMDFDAKIQLSEEFHQVQRSDKSVFSLLERAKKEYKKERRDSVLRRVSYNQPSSCDLKRKVSIPLYPAKKIKFEDHKHGALSMSKEAQFTEDDFSDDDEALSSLVEEDEFSDDEDLISALVEDDQKSRSLARGKVKQDSKSQKTESSTRNENTSKSRDMPTVSKRTASEPEPIDLPEMEKGPTPENIVIKPPPPGEYYRRKFEVKKPERDYLDEIFDDSDGINNIFDSDDSFRRTKTDIKRAPRTQTRSPVEYLTGDELLDQIFKEPS